MDGIFRACPIQLLLSPPQTLNRLAREFDWPLQSSRRLALKLYPRVQGKRVGEIIPSVCLLS